MWLTDQELADLSAHMREVGAIRGNVELTSVHVSPGPKATRESALAELRRVNERIAAGDFEVVADIDEGTVAWWGTYKALRDMGWSRIRAGIHVVKKWAERKTKKEG